MSYLKVSVLKINLLVIVSENLELKEAITNEGNLLFSESNFSVVA